MTLLDIVLPKNCQLKKRTNWWTDLNPSTDLRIVQMISKLKSKRVIYLLKNIVSTSRIRCYKCKSWEILSRKVRKHTLSNNESSILIGFMSLFQKNRFSLPPTRNKRNNKRLIAHRLQVKCSGVTCRKSGLHIKGKNTRETLLIIVRHQAKTQLFNRHLLISPTIRINHQIWKPIYLHFKSKKHAESLQESSTSTPI